MKKYAKCLEIQSGLKKKKSDWDSSAKNETFRYSKNLFLKYPTYNLSLLK